MFYTFPLLALISQRVKKNKHDVSIDVLESTYTEYFSPFGLHLIPVSNFLPDPVAFAKQIKPDVIILTGGNDVEEKSDIIHFRNNTEAALLQYAIHTKTPLFGICRGLQFIHHFFGGKLIPIDNHVRVTHPIRLTLQSLEGTYTVNSYHNSAIVSHTISENLEIIATCETDGSIEALQHRTLPILGIMWHPERDQLLQDSSVSSNLIRSFVQKIKSTERHMDFELWNKLKKKTHFHETIVYCHTREIWSTKVGHNVGFEQNGVGQEFLRPILIVKKFNQRLVWGIPLTTKSKKGKYYASIDNSGGKKAVAILSQLRLFDTKRLKYKIGVLDEKTFTHIQKTVIEILQSDNGSLLPPR